LTNPRPIGDEIQYISSATHLPGGYRLYEFLDPEVFAEENPVGEEQIERAAVTVKQEQRKGTWGILEARNSKL
jgi:hypothetical protein